MKKGLHESGIPKDIKSRVNNFVKRREQNWQQYVLPISKLNEEWHKSQKITFEKIWSPQSCWTFLILNP